MDFCKRRKNLPGLSHAGTWNAPGVGKRGKGHSSPGASFNSSVPSSGLGQADSEPAASLDQQGGYRARRGSCLPKATQGQRKSPT